jgi:AhpD family alkylhydroperoxidase
MARVAPVHREEVPELESAFAQVAGRMGFVPNSMLTMARRPEIMRTFGALAQVARTGTVDPQLKERVALVASTAAGCRYCQAHTASNAARVGSQVPKIAQVWEYETSQLFTDPERAALRLAHHAALVPNQATDGDSPSFAVTSKTARSSRSSR